VNVGTDTASANAFRQELAAWLGANLTPEVVEAGRRGFDNADDLEVLRAWNRTLADAGWAAVAWPTEHGGRSASLGQQLAHLEEMARVAHFFSLFLSVWSSPGMNISWMTDEDDIVANAGRLEDAHQFAARLSGIYVPHSLGEFMMNTPAVIADESAFEDFLAIPDLAAGMLGEVLSINSSDEAIRRPGMHGQKPLTQKSDTIADWFWHSTGTLKKTCILIDRATEGNFSIGQLKMSWE
jgi:hypothetical protein